MEFSELNDDIWDKLISYLNLKSIYSLEFADIFLQGGVKKNNNLGKKIK
jgi:hypothetical protein